MSFCLTIVLTLLDARIKIMTMRIATMILTINVNAGLSNDRTDVVNSGLHGRVGADVCVGDCVLFMEALFSKISLID